MSPWRSVRLNDISIYTHYEHRRALGGLDLIIFIIILKPNQIIPDLSQPPSKLGDRLLGLFRPTLKPGFTFEFHRILIANITIILYVGQMIRSPTWCAIHHRSSVDRNGVSVLGVERLQHRHVEPFEFHRHA